jgi:hypothetical protein
MVAADGLCCGARVVTEEVYCVGFAAAGWAHQSDLQDFVGVWGLLFHFANQILVIVVQ